jgi:glycosyltransferase involved in cell wall biosynthesis
VVVSTWGAEMIPMAPEVESDRQGKIALLRRANRIVASSHCLAEATRNYAGLEQSRVETQYWGVDLKQFSCPAQRPPDPVIGFAKALTPKYGAEYLIKALPQVLRSVPEARVMMLGSGDEESRLRTIAAQLEVSDSISWHGAVRHAEMPSYYGRMALSVVPSVHESETLAVSALESQAMHVPVVASRIGGLKESVLDGQTGILVPPRDELALAEAIIRLLTDNSLRERLGTQGRKRVELQFDWQQTLDSMLRIYRDVLRISSVENSVVRSETSRPMVRSQD